MNDNFFRFNLFTTILPAFTLFFVFSLLTGVVHVIDSSASSSTKARKKLTLQDVPRVSAYEAFLKFKAGKAIIVSSQHAQNFKVNHIAGSLNVCVEDVHRGKINLPNLPRKGLEIFTYCY